MDRQLQRRINSPSVDWIDGYQLIILWISCHLILSLLFADMFQRNTRRTQKCYTIPMVQHTWMNGIHISTNIYLGFSVILIIENIMYSIYNLHPMTHIFLYRNNQFSITFPCNSDNKCCTQIRCPHNTCAISYLYWNMVKFLMKLKAKTNGKVLLDRIFVWAHIQSPYVPSAQICFTCDVTIYLNLFHWSS